MQPQELKVILRFRQHHSPGDDFHLKKLMTLNDHYIAKSDVVVEGDNLVIYIG